MKYNKSTEFWIAAEKAGLLSVMHVFTKLKFRDNIHKPSKQDLDPFHDTKLNKAHFKEHPYSKHHDSTGAFIKRSELKKIAKEIKIPYNTLRGKLPRMEAIGLITRTETGWYLISMLRAAELIGANLKRLRLKAKTKQELKEKITLSIIKFTRKVQDNIRSEANGNEVGVMSLRTLAERMGVKSHNTANRRIVKLEKQGNVIVQRSALFKITKCDYFGHEIKICKYPCNIYYTT